jgi:8-oxo-dGTP diphosphatase
VREIREESGLKAGSVKLKGLLTFPAFAKDEDWYAFVFLVDEFDGKLIDSPEGELQWVEDSRLLDLNLWEGDRIFLPWLDQPHFFSGKFIYQDGRLVDHQVVFHAQ